MTNRRNLMWQYLALLAAGYLTLDRAQAQTVSKDTVKSEIYFGSRTADGKMVSDEAWNQFFSEIVVPRFPTGLTVLEALGRSGTNPGPLTRTRILVVVHPNEQSVEKRLREIKTEYRKRFGAAGIFHTDQPIQIHPEN